MAGETRDDTDDRGEQRARDDAPAALARIGHLRRLHEDEAELYPLRDVALMKLGRGTVHLAQGIGEALTLTVHDEWMSAPHATIEREGPASRPSFRLLDQGSRNGVLIDGRRLASHVLRHGDVFILGRTAWRFHGRPLRAVDELTAISARPFGPTRSVAPAMLAELLVLDRAAPSMLTVLVGGPSGSGKEIVARELHARSKRAGAFVAVNCAALPETMIEAQLFGHKKGAFTGAATDAAGFVAAADGGTLFLDEVGEMSLPAQAKLLRVLEQREVLPVGEVKPRKVDLRVVAATNVDLRGRVADGRFRADLYARLAQVTVTLPRLADRREDLGILIAHVCRRLGVKVGTDAARALLAYDWPLDVRELTNALESAALLVGEDETIDGKHLPPALVERAATATAFAAQTAIPSGGAGGAGDANDASSASAADPSDGDAGDDDAGGGSCPPREELVALLQKHRGNVTAAAREAGKGKMQLYRWFRRRGLDPAQYR